MIQFFFFLRAPKIKKKNVLIVQKMYKKNYNMRNSFQIKYNTMEGND